MKDGLVVLLGFLQSRCEILFPFDLCHLGSLLLVSCLNTAIDKIIRKDPGNKWGKSRIFVERIRYFYSPTPVRTMLSRSGTFESTETP